MKHTEMTELQIEHMAARASELGDTETEAMCDGALAGLVETARVADVASNDDRYAGWMDRGIDRGWSTRMRPAAPHPGDDPVLDPVRAIASTLTILHSLVVPPHANFTTAPTFQIAVTCGAAAGALMPGAIGESWDALTSERALGPVWAAFRHGWEAARGSQHARAPRCD